ncbi:hypothetical protein B484DRAFT_443546 [Ochromonadaceae sp. CCMP2298]|nr:hypothetical protein B484DRAFT_443546 [Ochromonadaceae sp. CCMP2298]
MVVGSSLLQRSLVLRAMRGMQIAYCRAVHAQLMLVRQGRQRPSAAGAASAAARLRFKGGGRGGGRGEGGGDQTRPGRQGEGSDGESVEEDGEEGWEGEGEEDGEGQFLSQTQLALRRKERARRQRKISRDRYPERQKRAPLHLPQASRTAQSSAGLGMGMVGAGTRVGLGLSGMGGTAGARARQQSLRDDTLSLKDPSFRSPQCHRHLLRLSQTGVFVYDAASMGAAPSASGLSPNALTAEEVCFCLQHAETVFLQGTRKALLRNVAAHFQGSKLVLVGGALAAGAVSELLAGLLREEREQATEGAGVGVVGEGAGVEESLSLHLSAVRMGTAARLSLLLSLLDAPPSYAGSSSRVCGVAVDSDSLGLLGCALLCRVLRYNSRLTSLAIKLGEAGAIGGGGGEVPHCLAEGLQLLSGNPALRDLRLFGAALPEAAVQALLHGIRGAFPCLALLEFSVQLGGGAAEAAEAVVEAAKDRAFAGRQGVSVTVNYR